MLSFACVTDQLDQDMIFEGLSSEIAELWPDEGLLGFEDEAVTIHGPCSRALIPPGSIFHFALWAMAVPGRPIREAQRTAGTRLDARLRVKLLIAQRLINPISPRSS